MSPCHYTFPYSQNLFQDSLSVQAWFFHWSVCYFLLFFFYLLNFTVYPLFSWLLQIAITGKSFCRASAIATELIISNILRIGRVNVIGDVILYLGKLCVSLSSALFAFLMLDTHKYRSAHNKISSPLLPVLVCALIPSQTSRYSNSCMHNIFPRYFFHAIETSDSKCLYFVCFCTCAGLLGPRLRCCDSLLRCGGDVNWCYHSFILSGFWGAPGDSTICSSSSDGDTGWSKWDAETYSMKHPNV